MSSRTKSERNSVRRSGVAEGSLGVSTGGNTLGATGVRDINGTYVLEGVGGITLSQSVGAGGIATVRISGAAAGGGVAISAGGSSQGTGTVSFANSNGINFGLSNGTLTGSIIAIQAVSISGGPSFTGGTFVLSNITDPGGVQFSLVANTLTASVPFARISYTENYRMADMLNGDFLIGSVLLQHFVIPAVKLDATQLDLMVNISNSSSAGATISYRVGVYTLSGSTASLVSSASRTLAYNSTLGGSSSYTNVSNWRMHSIALGTWSFTPGDYLMAFWVSTASALTNGSYSFRNGRNITNLGEPFSSVNYSKYWNAMGAFASTTTNLPTTIHLSNHIVTFASNVEVNLYPWVQIAGTF
jgi:hypothetical protein